MSFIVLHLHVTSIYFSQQNMYQIYTDFCKVKMYSLENQKVSRNNSDNKYHKKRKSNNPDNWRQWFKSSLPPAALYWPGSHCTGVASGVGQEWPTGQSVQDVAPSAEYWAMFQT